MHLVSTKLLNPVAALISVPFQLNYDRNIGPEDDGFRWALNIQPVIPASRSGSTTISARRACPRKRSDRI
jgi:hypothetical protein